MRIRKIFSKALICLIFIVIGWILSNLYHIFQQEKEIPEVVTVEVGKGRIREKIGLTTKVGEKEVVNITSSVEKGRIDRVHVRAGDYVTIGQILIELRRDELVNTLKKEELNLEQSKKKQMLLLDINQHPDRVEKDEEKRKIEWNLTQAEQTLEDNKELYAKQAIAYREVEKQGLEVKEARMNLDKIVRETEELVKKLQDQRKELEIEIPSLCQRIDELKEQIKNCMVYSPISGIVRKIAIEKNQKVEYGTLLLSIGDQSELIARGSLKEANFFLIKQGQVVELNSEAFGKSFKGRVLKVIPAAGSKDEKDAKEGGWEVVCSIENPEGLRIGMELSCEVIIKEKKTVGLLIPPEALYEEDCVLVVEKERLKKKKIVLGEGTTDQIEVIDGLNANDRVVVQYPEEIKEGMRVKVKL